MKASNMKFAVIGTFWLCENMIKALLNVDGAEYYAQYSRSLKKAEDFSKPFGKVKLFDDLEKLAKDPDIDAVYIASPNALHYQQAKLMLENGKHVLLEKPFTTSVDDTQKLISEAKKRNLAKNYRKNF